MTAKHTPSPEAPKVSISDLIRSDEAETRRMEAAHREATNQGMLAYVYILLNPDTANAAEQLADLRRDFPWLTSEVIRADAAAIARFKNDAKNCGAAVRADRAKARLAAKEVRDSARRALENAERALGHAAAAESAISGAEYRVRELLRTHAHIFVADADGVAGVSILGESDAD